MTDLQFPFIFPPGWCNVSYSHWRTNIYRFLRWLDQGKQSFKLAKHFYYTHLSPFYGIWESIFGLFWNIKVTLMNLLWFVEFLWAKKVKNFISRKSELSPPKQISQLYFKMKIGIDLLRTFHFNFFHSKNDTLFALQQLLCQFHQHLSIRFNGNFLLLKNYTPKL